jgi:hypothetical protein
LAAVRRPAGAIWADAGCAVPATADIINMPATASFDNMLLMAFLHLGMWTATCPCRIQLHSGDEPALNALVAWEGPLAFAREHATSAA